MSELIEKIIIWIAWHLPKDIVTWAFFRVAGFASTGEFGGENPDNIKMMTAIDRWMTKGE